MRTKNITKLIFITTSFLLSFDLAHAESSSDVFLTGDVENYYSLSIPQVSVTLPSSNSLINYKIADFLVKSNMPQVQLTYSCASSPTDNSSCDLVRSGGLGQQEGRIGYSLNFDQSIFSGVTNFNGSIYINYSISSPQMAGTYSDTITITVTPN